MDELVAALWALTPPILIGLVFWFILRSIARADRAERKAFARIEAEERARRGLPRLDGPQGEASQQR